MRTPWDLVWTDCRGRGRRLSLRWRRDEAGAALVQFIVVLPIFVLIVVGLWAMYQAYSAQQTMCEAVWEASRYLQVEGPLLDPVLYPYPSGWEQLATGIINTELKSNAAINIAPVIPGDVDISPDTMRKAPEDTTAVSADTVPDSWFFVKATSAISNPLAIFIPGAGPNGTLRVTCKGTGFFEGPPLGPTKPSGGVDCPIPERRCGPTPPGATPSPTPCDPGDPRCGCPVCRP